MIWAPSDKPGARAERMHSDLFLHRLATLRLDLDLMRGLIDAVAQRLDAEDAAGRLGPDPEDIGFQLLVNNLKLAGASLPLRVVEGLVTIVGMAQGYLRRSPLALERALRDLRSAALMYHDDRLLHANGMLLLTGAPALRR